VVAAGCAALVGAALGTDGPQAAAIETPPTAASILNAERRLITESNDIAGAPQFVARRIS
jgi:hypothetical protein